MQFYMSSTFFEVVFFSLPFPSLLIHTRVIYILVKLFLTLIAACFSASNYNTDINIVASHRIPVM